MSELSELLQNLQLAIRNCQDMCDEVLDEIMRLKAKNEADRMMAQFDTAIKTLLR